jgi:hypothetical protein
VRHFNFGLVLFGGKKTRRPPGLLADNRVDRLLVGLVAGQNVDITTFIDSGASAFLVGDSLDAGSSAVRTASGVSGQKEVDCRPSFGNVLDRRTLKADRLPVEETSEFWQ